MQAPPEASPKATPLALLLSDIEPSVLRSGASLPARSWNDAYHGITAEDALKALTALGKQVTPNFHVSPENIDAYEKAVCWLLALPHPEIDDPMKGLLVSGSTGTGKTLLVRLLYQLSKVLDLKRPFWDGGNSKEKLMPFLWNDTRHVSDHVSAYIESPNASFPDLSYRVLHIGDLGAEPENFSRYGTRGSIADLICQRADQGYRYAPMVVTTNLPWSEIHRLYGDRAYSRLQGDLIEVVLTGQDHRQEQPAEART